MHRDPPAAEVVQQLMLDNASSFLVSRRFLRARLLAYSVTRFGVSIGIVAGAWFGALVAGIEGLPLTWLHILAATLLAYNTLVFGLLYLPTWDYSCAHRYLSVLMQVTVSIDFVFLTATLWLIGGAASPFASFYILHIILAALLLPRIAVVIQVVIGYILFACLVLAQWLELLPAVMPLGAVLAQAPITGRYAATVLTVQAILFVVTALLVSEIAAALKRGERALSELNTELKQLSEMRRDFLHVVTHNLKAPAAAATMLLETVETLWSLDVSENAREAIKRARMRTQELGELIQDMQQLTALESGALHKQEQAFNLNEIARKLADEYGVVAARKNQTIKVELDEGLPDVYAVPRLILEAAVNYVTNAIKYTPEGGHITLRTRRGCREGIFEVEDNGVGVAPDHLEDLFGEFVRAPAQVGGQHPPGIGLGLSIVKRILQYYNGRVFVRSTPEKGSTFGFAMPLPGAPPAAQDQEAS